jgi:16S rRNA A1518/A1519 N6-dimethyltransferase RsmA/KsgA/DIM1 with predicted DNA glycosylase/AP lyase activity
VKKTSFFPQPEVESTLIRIDPVPPEQRPVPAEKIPAFEAFIRSVFNFPKKNTANSLYHSRVTDMSKQESRAFLEQNDIDPEKPIVSCTPWEFITLFEALEETD